MVTLQASSSSKLRQGARKPLAIGSTAPPARHGARRCPSLQQQQQQRASTLRVDASSSSQPVTPGGGGVRRGPDAGEAPARSAKASASASASMAELGVADLIGSLYARVLSSAVPPLVPPLVPEAVIQEVEHKLEADMKTVGVTLAAILGVITFWRGVWSLLDHLVGDSVLGDVGCSVVGLAIVLYIRLSGSRLANFWPPS
jgi:hypothetical protein